MKIATTNYANTTTFLAVGQRATNTCIKNRIDKSGLQFLADLQKNAHNDRIRLNATAHFETISKLTAEHEEHRKNAEELKAIANRISTPTEQRAEAHKQYKKHTEAMKHCTDQIKTLEAVLNLTISDRADLEQVAHLAHLEALTNPPEADERDTARAETILEEVKNATHKAPHKSKNAHKSAVVFAEDIEATAQEIRIYRAVVNAVGNYITAMQNTSTFNRTKTTKQLLTAEQTAEYISTYGGIGKDYKHKTDNGNTQYIEHRKYKKHPSGIYLITETKTHAPCISYEEFTEDNGDMLETLIVSNNGINIITDQQARTDIESLIERAELTDRERQFLLYFLDNTSAKNGQKAVNEYHKKNGKKATKQGAEAERYQAMKKSAFERIGIHAKQTQSDFFKRITKRLEAHRTEPTHITAEEREHRHIITAFRNRQTTSTAIIDSRADLIKWTEQTAPTTHTAVIKWQTAEESATARHLAEIDRKRNGNHSKIDNATAEAIHNGKVAELRYTIKHTAHTPQGAFTNAKESAFILAEIITD